MQKIVAILGRHKVLSILLGLIIFYLLFAYFAVNPIAKRAVPWAAQKYLASQASVESVHFDPLRLKTTIKDLKLTQKNGDHLVGFDQLLIDLEASGLFDWAWKFKEITITKPKVDINVSKSGVINWAALMDATRNDAQAEVDNNATIPRVILGRIAILDGQLDYQDASRDTPVQTSLSPINLSLDGLSTLPNDSGAYHITALLPQQAGEIEWTGDLTVNPLSSNGQLAFKEIELTQVLDLVKGLKLPLITKQGSLDLNFDYDFSFIKNPPIEKASPESKKPTLIEVDPTIHLMLNNVALQLRDLEAQLKTASRLSTKLVNIQAPNIALNVEGETALTFASLSASLDDLTFSSLNNVSDQTLLKLPHVDINEVAFNLANNQLDIGQVLLNQGVVHAVKGESGVLNWQAAFEANPDAPAVTKPGETQGESNPKDNIVKPEATVSATTTQPVAIPASDATPARKPFRLAIEEIKFNHWQADFKDASYVNPLSVNINDIEIGLQVGIKEKGLVIDQLNTTLSKLSAHSTLSKQPIATLNSVKLSDSHIVLDEKKISLNTIIASDLNTVLIRNQSKQINWVTALKARPKLNTAIRQTAASESNARLNANKDAPSWAVSLKKLALHQAAIHIEDQTPTVPVQLDIAHGAVEISNISDNLSQASPIQLGFIIKHGGAFNVRGKVTPSPLKTNLKVNLKDLSLKPFAPYINQVALLKLNDGATSLAGRLTLNQHKSLSGGFKGGFSVNNLSVLEEANDAPFLSWAAVSSDDVNLAIGPNALTIGHLNLDQLASKLIINEDKTMNITRILRSEQGKPKPVDPVKDKPEQNLVNKTAGLTGNSLIKHKNNKKVTTSKTKVVKATVSTAHKTVAFPFNIETVNIKEAELDFADLSLRPQFGAHINTLSGVINQISTDASKDAKVNLSGKVNEFGTAKINGTLKPFNALDMTDIKLAFTNLDMHKLTPYSGKFAGRRIDSGKMSVDLAYKITQHQLAGENKFVINQLKLGDKIESKDAADLPLDLAIAVLEDNDGIIDLDLSISGDLDNPEFKVSGIIWKAFKNVMTSIVTAPFKALGSLFGGKGKDLATITFEPGNTVLQPPEQEKLKAVSEALNKRHGLALTITPRYVVASDTRALQAEITRESVLKEAGLTNKVGAVARPIDMENEAIQTAIKSLHDDFTNKSLFKKLSDKINKPEPAFYTKALEALITNTKVTKADLALLANKRGEAIKQHIIDAGVEESRVMLNKSEPAKQVKTIEAVLSIGVNKTVKATTNHEPNTKD